MSEMLTIILCFYQHFVTFFSRSDHNLPHCTLRKMISFNKSLKLHISAERQQKCVKTSAYAQNSRFFECSLPWPRSVMRVKEKFTKTCITLQAQPPDTWAFLQNFQICHRPIKGSSVRRPLFQSYACFSKFFLNPRDATWPGRTAFKEPTVLSIRWSALGCF